jgi:hypothetical protein
MKRWDWFSWSLEDFKENWASIETKIIFDKKIFFKKVLTSVLLIIFWIVIVVLKHTDVIYITRNLIWWIWFPMYILISNYWIFVFWIFSFFYWILQSLREVKYFNKWNKRLINKIDDMY